MYRPAIVVGALVALTVPLLSFASSHREAPNIAGSPRVDGTDLYLFRSYESGRTEFRHRTRQLHSISGPQRGTKLLSDGCARGLRHQH